MIYDSDSDRLQTVIFTDALVVLQAPKIDKLVKLRSVPSMLSVRKSHCNVTFIVMYLEMKRQADLPKKERECQQAVNEISNLERSTEIQSF